MQYIWIFGYLAAVRVEMKFVQKTACPDGDFFPNLDKNHRFRDLEGIWRRFGTSKYLDI
jgi:hypothetical protein